MAHYAQIENNKVTQVIVADEDYIKTRPKSERWIQTSYNTRGNVHILGGTPLRKNYAGIGYHYDELLDAFIPPRPYPSWNLNAEIGLWEPPQAYPQDGFIHEWDEGTQIWVKKE
jgi:hypothetical protein